MKKSTLLTLAIIYGGLVYGQFGAQQIISTNLDSPYTAIPLDIDGDGYLDILSAASGNDYKLYWFKNIDGIGNFSDAIEIQNTPIYYYALQHVDLDADGDKDLLYSQGNPDNINWFENLDGAGTFGQSEIIVPAPSDYHFSMEANDIDNDGDLDLVLTATDLFSFDIVWHENIDGQGTFGAREIIIEEIFEVYPPVLVDIDNDGLTDILTAHEPVGPAKLVWYKNLGNMNFSPEMEIYYFPFFASDFTSIIQIEYTDINTDGKTDIVITSHNDDIGTFYYWFEHLDNKGNFGPIQSLQYTGIFVDIDDDGDIDILNGSRYTNRIWWVENSDGMGTFTPLRYISFEIDFLRYLGAADLNSDGLLDVVSASSGDNKVAWYENTGILETPENILKDEIILHPNPVSDILHIESSDSLNISEIQVYDLEGRLVYKSTDNKSSINTSGFHAGLYLVSIVTEHGNFHSKVVKN